MKTQLENRLESQIYSAEPSELTINRLQMHKQNIKEHIKEIEQNIKDLIASDKDIQKKVDLLMTILGIGFV